MTLKIEVGDKVRIVAEGGYGHGHQGTVMLGPDNVGGYLVWLGPDDKCWYLVDEITLFADELEDMPADTIAVDATGLCRTAGGRACSIYPEAIQNQVEDSCKD